MSPLKAPEGLIYENNFVFKIYLQGFFVYFMLIYHLFAWILRGKAECFLPLCILLTTAIKQLFEALVDILDLYRCCALPYICTGN